MAKVLALVSFKVFPPHMGGQKGVALFYEHLSCHHQVIMAASNDHWEGMDASYPVVTMLYPNRRMYRNLGVLSELESLVKKENVDCIIAEHSYTGWLAYLLHRRTKKPFIIHSHNLEGKRFQQMNRRWWKIYQGYEGWIHRKAGFTFFISEEDQEKALTLFKLQKERCAVIPYGIDIPEKVESSRAKLMEELDLGAKYIFHFNGTLDYEPNFEAVENLVERVDPLLRQTGLDYLLLISGKRLIPRLQHRIVGSPTIRYVDFIPDINVVYQGCDLFVNPVTNDSGVKTKVIEALANGCKVVSTVAGAAGIPEDVAGEQLIKVKDGDWPAFVAAVTNALTIEKTSTPASFFEYFSWTNIAAKAAAHIQEVIRQ